MSNAVILEPRDFDKLLMELKETLRTELAKTKEEVMEAPMTMKETAKYLKCHENTVRKNWTHLRHMVNSTPYWYAYEISEHIKRQ